MKPLRGSASNERANLGGNVGDPARTIHGWPCTYAASAFTSSISLVALTRSMESSVASSVPELKTTISEKVKGASM